MSPALDLPLNRREAVASLLAMLAFVLGTGDGEAAEVSTDSVENLEPVPMPEFVQYWENGLPAPTTALLTAFGSATIVGAEFDRAPVDPEPYRTVLRDALTITERTTYGELHDAYMRISRQREEMVCPACFGFGDRRRAGRSLGPCEPCHGTGLRDGGVS